MMPPRARRQDRADHEEHQRGTAAAASTWTRSQAKRSHCFSRNVAYNTMRLRVGPVPREAELGALAARNPEGRADGVVERRRWRPSRAARPEDMTSSATESWAMTEKTSARQRPLVRATSRHRGGACNSAMRRFDRKRRREVTQLAAVIVCLVAGV